MVIAIFATDRAFSRATRGAHAFSLVVEIAVGAATYAASALVVARATSLDFISLVRRIRARRMG